MYLAVATALRYGAFVAYRLGRRGPVPKADLGLYQALSARAPSTAELALNPPRSTRRWQDPNDCT